MPDKTLTIPKTLFREAAFETRAIDETERTIDLSISSDTPYERYFGMEILDHSEKCLNMERMRGGAQLLFNHDRSFVLGKIVEAKSDGTTLRIKAKIAQNAKAQDLWPDIQSGVISKASVGYCVDEMKLEQETKGGPDVYRVTRWTPYEGSLVTIPADTSVGVGRGAEDAGTKEIIVSAKKEVDDSQVYDKPPQTKSPTMPETVTPTEPKIDVNHERGEAVFAERKRVADITELNTHFLTKGVAGRCVDASKICAEMIREGKTVADFQNAVVRSELPEAKRLDDTPDKGIGMTTKDLGKYSLLRAINSIATGQRRLEGLEKECSDQVSRDCNRETQGFFIPQDVMQHRYLASNVFTAAGALIETGFQGQSMIELLRNNMMVAKMGARYITGLKGNLSIPSQTGGATASWISEDATITGSNQAVGQVSLTPHRLTAATAFTFQLLAQSTPDAENFVREDLMLVIAIAKDLAALAGTGVSGQPLGINNTASLSTSVTLAGANSMTYANAVQFETNVATNNAAQGRLGYLASIATRGNSKLVAEISAANSIPVWKNDMVNGYPAFATTQLTTLPSVIFGNWNDLIVADWGGGGNEVIVDPYSLSMQGQVRIVMQQLSDVAIRHGKSFSISTT